MDIKTQNECPHPIQHIYTQVLSSTCEVEKLQDECALCGVKFKPYYDTGYE